MYNTRLLRLTRFWEPQGKLVLWYSYKITLNNFSNYSCFFKISFPRHIWFSMMTGFWTPLRRKYFSPYLCLRSNLGTWQDSSKAREVSLGFILAISACAWPILDNWGELFPPDFRKSTKESSSWVRCAQTQKSQKGTDLGADVRLDLQLLQDVIPSKHRSGLMAKVEGKWMRLKVSSVDAHFFSDLGSLLHPNHHMMTSTE